MFYRGFRRSSSRRYAKAAVLGAVLLTLLDLFSLLSQYGVFRQTLYSSIVEERSHLPSTVRNDKIYITAQFWTNAQVLYEHWNEAFIRLVIALGPKNVYVSIVESGSLDNTKDFLRYLAWKLEELGVQQTIVLDETSHQDELWKVPGVNTTEEGWIRTPGHPETWERRRIPFLARERNKGLEPLKKLAGQGVKFDKILVLNDVVFEPSDVLTLLATRGGRYAAACALDFHYAPDFYDTFALRDSEGQETIMRTVPYFRSPESRNAILKGEPARVQSCWNGMVFMDAAPFYDTGGHPGLTYRGIPDSLAAQHVEGSECCLIWTDLTTTGGAEAGIWINPAVRVGYVPKAYNDTHMGPDRDFLHATAFVEGVWRNRFLRWTGSVPKGAKAVKKGVAKWKAEGKVRREERSEVGEMCLIDEMHVLIFNGWKHL